MHILDGKKQKKELLRDTLNVIRTLETRQALRVHVRYLEKQFLAVTIDRHRTISDLLDETSCLLCVPRLDLQTLHKNHLLAPNKTLAALGITSGDFITTKVGLKGGSPKMHCARRTKAAYKRGPQKMYAHPNHAPNPHPRTQYANNRTKSWE